MIRDKTELVTKDSDSSDQIDEKTCKAQITQSPHFSRLCVGIKHVDMPPIDLEKSTREDSLQASVKAPQICHQMNS